MAMYLGSDKVAGSTQIEMKGTTLWEGFVATSFDLADDAENYEYLDFYCGKGAECPCCIRVPRAMYNQYSLRTIYKDNDNLTQCLMKVISITGKRVTVTKYSVVNWTNSSSQTYNSNELQVFKVVGYKKEAVGTTEELVSIVEKGSNSNGSYIKYSDGTMICYGNPSGTSNNADWWSFCNRTDENIVINFPHKFKEIPNVTVAPDNYSGVFTIMVGNRTPSYFTFTGLRAKSNGGTGWSFEFQAIGKWK